MHGSVGSIPSGGGLPLPHSLQLWTGIFNMAIGIRGIGRVGTALVNLGQGTYNSWQLRTCCASMKENNKLIISEKKIEL